MKKNRSGFTLIELMIVIAIIGILAGIAVPAFNKARKQARERKCFEGSSLLTRLSEQYNIDYKVYPLTIPNLAPYCAGSRLPICPTTKTSDVYEFVLAPPTEDTGADVKCTRHGYVGAIASGSGE